jgi:hypothetical protein
VSKPWIKLWARWYETTSHLLMSPHALHTGPHLLMLASKYGRRDDGSAALVGPTGEPLTLGDLARLTRWPPKTIGTVVRELTTCGTLEQHGRTYVFPRFDRYQESSSAARVRKHRERSCNVTDSVTVTDDVTPLKRPKTEDRRQKTDSPKAPRKRGDIPPAIRAKCDEVIDRLNERRAYIAERFGLPKRKGFGKTDTLRKFIAARLAEGEDLETLLAVVDARARKIVREGGEGFEHLTTSTPFRPANWAYSLGLIDEHPRKTDATSAPEKPVETVDEARAHLEREGSLPHGWVFGDTREQIERNPLVSQ